MKPLSSFHAPNSLVWACLAIALVLALPVLSVLTSTLAGGTGDILRHLASTVLPEYLANTLMLCVGVAIGVVGIGVGTAWLVAAHDFPGRRFFAWALVLPLAMPAYVMAYVYTDFLQFSGPLQSAWRELAGGPPGAFRLPEVRSLGGAIVMFVFVFYPYVYVLARPAFAEHAVSLREAAQALGAGPWRVFARVALPLARPAVVAGATLALMETLADYGTVSYFGVNTFTTGIYRTWFALGDRIAAAQLSAGLFACVALLLVGERLSRGRARFDTPGGRPGAARVPRLRGVAAGGAVFACALPLCIGFVLPAGLLFRLALAEGDAQFGTRFLLLARNSLLLAVLTALLAVLLAVVIAYAARHDGGRLTRGVKRFVALGYAIPGSVIAVGVLIPVTRLDLWLAAQWQALFGNNPGLLLTGGIAALVYAYLVRFLAVALQSVSAGLEKIRPNLDEAARSLGLRAGPTLRRVHFPLLRGSLLGGALLVFVDVMKELPATLVMRPFNFDTLATQVYSLAADERLAEASTAALAIVAVGLLPLILLARQPANR